MRNPFKSNLPKFPTAAEGVEDFWATVHVKLNEPIYITDDPGRCPTQGYYRNFGVRADPSEVPDVLLRSVDDGQIDWSESEWHTTDVSRLNEAIRQFVKPVAGVGVWYRSGRIFYADPDLEPVPN